MRTPSGFTQIYHLPDHIDERPLVFEATHAAMRDHGEEAVTSGTKAFRYDSTLRFELQVGNRMAFMGEALFTRDRVWTDSWDPAQLWVSRYSKAPGTPMHYDACPESLVPLLIRACREALFELGPTFDAQDTSILRTLVSGTSI